MVLTPTIVLWKFESPLGFQIRKRELTWECEDLIPHIRLHSRASFLAHTLASPCFGHEPKARVTTPVVMDQHFVSQLSIMMKQHFASKLPNHYHLFSKSPQQKLQLFIFLNHQNITLGHWAILLPSLLLNHTRLFGHSLSLVASNTPTHANIGNLSDEVHSINPLTIHPCSLAHGIDLQQTKYSQNKRNSMWRVVIFSIKGWAQGDNENVSWHYKDLKYIFSPNFGNKI